MLQPVVSYREFDLEDECRDTLDRFRKRIAGHRIGIPVPGEARQEQHIAFAAIATALQKIDIEGHLVECTADGLQRIVADFDGALFSYSTGLPFDGRLQAYFDMYNSIYTGSGPFAVALAARRAVLKLLLKAMDVDVPVFVGPADGVTRLLDRYMLLGYPLPALIWPALRGHLDVPTVIKPGFGWNEVAEAHSGNDVDRILEQLPEGKPLYIAAVEMNSRWVTLPAVEPTGGINAFIAPGEAKMQPAAIVPDEAQLQSINSVVQKIVQHFQCRGTLLLKLVVSNRIRPIDIETMPSLTEDAPLVLAARKAGFEHEILLLNLLSSAYRSAGGIPQRGAARPSV